MLKCEKCNRMMSEDNFYTKKDGQKMSMCKKCLTMHVNNFNPDTFKWILKEIDIPYVPNEWNILRDRAYIKDPNKMNGMSVIGRYISKMKLKQWRDYGYDDSEFLTQQQEIKTEEEKQAIEDANAELKKQFEEGLISESQYKTLVNVEALHADEPPRLEMPEDVQEIQNPYQEGSFVDDDLLPDPTQDLTDDDKVYLVMKWGRPYKLDELIKLEQRYAEMTNAFEVKDPDTDETLKLLCKTSLKMNNAIDIGDVDGYQKLSRVYDTLRKSAKFTAAQNKEEKGNFVDSVSQIVTLCEQEGGFIPRFATDIPQDKVDLTLKDMNSYVRKLVTQDLGFGQQIEDSIKKLQIQKEMREQDDGFDFGDPLKDDDFSDFYDQMSDQKEQDDLEVMREGVEE